MLKATGARTWARHAKGAKAVGLECDSDMVVTITPSANYADKGGSDLTELALKTRLWGDDLGEKLLAAFDVSS
jgi:hypothetical protein